MLVVGSDLVELDMHAVREADVLDQDEGHGLEESVAAEEAIDVNGRIVGHGHED